MLAVVLRGFTSSHRRVRPRGGRRREEEGERKEGSRKKPIDAVLYFLLLTEESFGESDVTEPIRAFLI